MSRHFTDFWPFFTIYLYAPSHTCIYNWIKPLGEISVIGFPDLTTGDLKQHYESKAYVSSSMDNQIKVKLNYISKSSTFLEFDLWWPSPRDPELVLVQPVIAILSWWLQVQLS